MLDCSAMTLFELKWLAALVIFGITVLTGILSVGFARRYRKQLEIGDAFANGVFIGAALFHLLPDAILSFEKLATNLVYITTVLLLVASYFIFWLLEKAILRKEKVAKHQMHVGILILILSIHAFIAGLTLGISETFSLVSIFFIAIIAHKGFETFAFVINIYRQIGRGLQLIILLIFFSLVTPAGIVLGILGNTVLHAPVDNLLTACFSAVAAGTFLYIGTAHSHHLRNHHDSYHQYVRFVVTIIGVVVMGVVGIWV